MIQYSGRKQQGAATLLVAVVLLIAVTLISFTVARSVITEKRVAANQQRSIAALEAAQAGLAAGIAHFRESGDMSVTLSGAVGSAGLERYETSFNLISAGKYRIEALGYSDDESARKVVSLVVKTPPSLSGLPDVPVVAKGFVGLTGSFNITNPEGNFTVWSGDDFDIGGSGETRVRHPTVANTLMNSSTKTYRGSDIIDNDPNLASMTSDEYARAILGDEADDYCGTYQQVANIKDAVISPNGGKICVENPGGGPVKWTANDDIGDSDTSYVLVAKGGLDMSGNGNFYGIVFSDGATENTGGRTIHGSFISTGIFGKAGNVEVIFSSAAIENLTGDDTESTGIPGTWKDW